MLQLPSINVAFCNKSGMWITLIRSVKSLVSAKVLLSAAKASIKQIPILDETSWTPLFTEKRLTG